MTISLRNLPLLVQLDIIKNITYSEAFNLSLCSARTLKMIKICKFPNVNAVRYFFNDEIMKVSIEEHDGGMESMVLLQGDQERGKIDEGQYQKISDFREDFRMSTRDASLDDYFVLDFDRRLEQLVKNLLHLHICEMFDNRFPIRLHVIADANLGVLPNIESVNDCRICEGHSEVINQLITSHPYINNVFIEKFVNNGLQDDHMLFGVQNLCMNQSGTESTTFLRQFTGRLLYLSSAECRNRHIVQFLEKWRSGRFYPNLRFLKIDLRRRRGFVQNEILADIETTVWDPAIRPGRVVDVFSVDHELNIEEYLDIKREGDGKLASLSIIPSSFKFLVWD
ncbi:hypothetical protein CAEBREN_06876 [Caenorhabditis brenneri]|uniref:F-box domain-containing protein n=1 Tax=Caenorhabditis brenneri TaxID=135651 RepID=G0NZK6_CAEBE|nr:hypothetical protein CAEBREN_06876 [Caenorhabditis brenneri]